MLCDICNKDYDNSTRLQHKHKEKMRGNVTIKEISGKEYHINANNLEEVKLYLNHTTGIPLEKQRFFANGKEITALEDNVIYVVFNKK